VSALGIASALVATLGGALVLLGCIALVFLREPFARLHYASLASIVGPLTLGVAALGTASLADAGGRALIFVAISLGGTALTTHALGRALYFRNRRRAAPAKGEDG
jgi:multisubunit Na+/H+ antiporter MnhG subunit